VGFSRDTFHSWPGLSARSPRGTRRALGRSLSTASVRGVKSGIRRKSSPCARSTADNDTAVAVTLRPCVLQGRAGHSGTPSGTAPIRSSERKYAPDGVSICGESGAHCRVRSASAVESQSRRRTMMTTTGPPRSAGSVESATGPSTIPRRSRSTRPPSPTDWRSSQENMLGDAPSFRQDRAHAYSG
jgi:hypothetical protein